MDAFVFWAAQEPAAQLRRFAEEVVPAVRAESSRRENPDSG
jgi:hypothetical protein